MNERRLRGRAKQIVNWGKNTTTNEGCGCGKKEGEEEEAAAEKTNGCLALSLSLSLSLSFALQIPHCLLWSGHETLQRLLDSPQILVSTIIYKI